MKKKGFNILDGVVLGGVGFMLYKYFAGPSLTKEQAVTILQAAGRNFKFDGYEDGYVIAWAQAVQKGQPSFTYNSQKFDSTKGTHIG